MKTQKTQNYALAIEAEDEHQPTIHELRDAISEIVEKKAKETVKGWKVEIHTTPSK